MKNIFTLFVALVATTTMMAQMPSTMKFVGQSNYSATIMGITASGGCETDTLTVSDIDATSNTSAIAIPSMTVEITGMFSKTIPAMTLTGVPFTMSMADGINISFSADSLRYTVQDGGEDKVVIVRNLSGSFSTSDYKMVLSFNMKYGSMPGELSFEEKDAVYVADGISEVTVEPTNSKSQVRKLLVDGKFTIIKGDKQYDAAGIMRK